MVHTELCSDAFRGSEMDVHSDSPEVGDLKYPSVGDRKCAEMVDPVVSAPSLECKLRECEGSSVSEAKIPNKMLENGPSQAAMKVQKVYRSYRTRRMLADSAVVAEELWWQALDYARLNHSTISFFNFSKPETAASRWNRISINASKVGKGLSKDEKARKLAFQHWIEAIDPRHRYGHNLNKYYEEWCKTDAGQPFFYWLDIGDGKEVDLEECPRSKLRQQCIKYLGPQERENYEYLVVEGKIVHKQTGNLLDTRTGTPKAKWIFVMSTSKRLHVGEKKKGIFHHSSFLAGGVTLAAGRLAVEDGVLKCISAYSGHYRPTDYNLDIFLQFLREHGVDMNNVEIRKATEDYETSEKGNWTKSQSNLRDSTVGSSEKLPNVVEKTLSRELIGVQETKNYYYRRTLSGFLQSSKSEVPKSAIQQRINYKKAAKSYQLGNQLSLKWSTGAGPRIGCIADYPLELRLQALEFTFPSWQLPLSSAPLSSPGQVNPLASTVSCPAVQIQQLCDGLKSC